MLRHSLLLIISVVLLFEDYVTFFRKKLGPYRFSGFLNLKGGEKNEQFFFAQRVDRCGITAFFSGSFGLFSKNRKRPTAAAAAAIRTAIL
ncbi:hypothetical protein [Chlorobium phaeobacteroides]|uniref:hypothetical protein n=1 Tax=Chlorobium phaeobacteroides TaxID=1096 RepID=UPI00059B7FC4|nr:hypothetical protein [Chlorobium phaeobacteroides]